MSGRLESYAIMASVIGPVGKFMIPIAKADPTLTYAHQAPTKC